MNGATAYPTKRFESAKNEFNSLQKRLEQIYTTGWPIYYQVDWQVVRAEMNGYDFNQRVLRPWVSVIKPDLDALAQQRSG